MPGHDEVRPLFEVGLSQVPQIFFIQGFFERLLLEEDLDCWEPICQEKGLEQGRVDLL